MDWFLRNKALVGLLLVSVGSAMLQSGNPDLTIPAQTLINIGTALGGAGVLKSDQFYKDKEADKKLTEQLKDTLNQ